MKLNLNFSIKIKKQIEAQGYSARPADIKTWERQAMMITGLYLVSLLSEQERNAAYNRLLSEIKSSIQPTNQ